MLRSSHAVRLWPSKTNPRNWESAERAWKIPEPNTPQTANLQCLSTAGPEFTRISAATKLAGLPREDISAYLNWQMSRAGPDHDVFTAAAADMSDVASVGNPRILDLLAQAAWLEAARSGTLNIEPDHVHKVLRQVPAASTKIPQP